MSKPRGRNHGPSRMLDLGIKIRLASNEDGPRMADLAREGGFQMPHIRWDDVYPYWLLAERNHQILGMVQVCHGRPIGRMEMLCLDEKLEGRDRAICARQLLVAGCATLRQNGSQAVTSLVPFKLKSYKRMIKNRGGQVADSGNIILFPL